MKFKLVDSGRLHGASVDGDVIHYMRDYERWRDDSALDATFAANIEWKTTRFVWCRPCDIRQLYLKPRPDYQYSDKGSKVGVVDFALREVYYGDRFEMLVGTYSHCNTEEYLDITSDRTAIHIITTSDYAMNIANGYFRTLGKTPGKDARRFSWLREYTINEGKGKYWFNNDITAAFSDLAGLMETVGVRDDTYLCIRYNNETFDVSNEGVRKARQRRKSAFSL